MGEMRCKPLQCEHESNNGEQHGLNETNQGMIFEDEDGIGFRAVLQGRDLEPNIGLHWYFFTEIPENLRLPFKWLFAALPSVSTLLIAVVSPNQPLFIALLHLVATSIFKSHPSAADVAQYLVCLLPKFFRVLRFLIPAVF